MLHATASAREVKKSLSKRVLAAKMFYKSCKTLLAKLNMLDNSRAKVVAANLQRSTKSKNF